MCQCDGCGGEAVVVFCDISSVDLKCWGPGANGEKGFLRSFWYKRGGFIKAHGDKACGQKELYQDGEQ